MGRVLVVGDVARVGGPLTAALRSRGHVVLEAGDGVSALLAAAREVPALVVLALPVGGPAVPVAERSDGEPAAHAGVSGVAALAALLADDPARPVLVLASPDEVPAGVRRLGPEALEWLPRPVSVERVVSRVEHRLQGPLRDATVPEDRLPVGSLALDLRARRLVTGPNGAAVELTRREFDLLAHLAREAGRVCPRRELLHAVWGHGPGAGSNVLDAAVARLRAKLARAAAGSPSGPVVETVRGRGYRLREG